jgi:drug/metabolite transporter (DMT)-like permease
VKQSKLTGYILAVFGMLMLSFTLIALKLGLESFSPIVMSFGRVIPASIVAIVALKISGVKLLPPREDLGRVLGLTIGVVMAFPAITAFSLEHINPGEAGVIGALGSIITAALSVLYGHKHPGRMFWIASAAGTIAAIGFALTRSADNPARGDILWYGLMFVAVLLWCWGQVTGGTLTSKHHSIHILAWAILIGTPINALITGVDLVVHPMTAWPTSQAWFGFFYVALVSMFLVFFIWYAAMDRIGMVKTSQLQLVQPIVTLIVSMILFGEVVPPSTWMFAALIIGAVAWTQSVGRKS